MDINIIGTKFIKPNWFGDFRHMIKNNINTNSHESLFIYNDNEECRDSKSYGRGAGNAVIRKYNRHNPDYKNKPYSIGIPTGTFSSGGYTELDENSKKYIDESINEIKELINEHKYKNLYYSVDDFSGKVGTSIFEVNEKVIEYITNEIHKLSINPIQLIGYLDNKQEEKDEEN